MKRLFFTFCMGLAVLTVNGQQKQGTVRYERTVQMQMRMRGMGPGPEAEQLLPRTHTSKLEVLFTADQCLRQAVEETTPDEFQEEGGGMHIRISTAGTDDVTYVNLASGQITEQREFGARNYIIADSVRKLNWKLTGQTTTILNYPCQQAITQVIGKRSVTTMENGEMKTEQQADTSNIIAWFTLAIPVSAGPEYQGQLPGLILGIDVNNGRTVYKATEISGDVEVSVVKAPSKGKRVTIEEFNKERDKIMAEMQRNGGGRVIRIGQ
ncbi:GLPGLI family protein [Chitinophaga sp. S165]|uniref:GLPGLI family protein n=1 Tax=Chitinophaga sp. S165 TaxID=2135462 RepID=UPI000D708E49|nr:GLPGLI family protein [Chitinophaga sp. S165]PWV57000.1 GLPGLI family protein [Chitinophaga sp. S165]